MKTILIVVVLGFVAFSAGGANVISTQASSLCESNENVVFSCTLKRPQKLLSLCASSDLTKTRGYIQYRFGLPGKIELEFPKSREHSAEAFSYKHYFRAQFDETEINFTNEGTNYSIFDDYNGEQKPSSVQQGVTVTPAGGGKDVTLVCNGRAKADFSKIEDVLPKVE